MGRRVGVVLRYLAAVASAFGLLLATRALEGTFQGVFFSIPIAALALLAMVLGAGPGLLASVLTGVGLWYFFQQPRSSFALAHHGEVARLVAFFVASSTIIAAIGMLHRTRRRLVATLADQRGTAERLAALSEAMPQFVFVARSDGVVEYVNRRWQAFIGLDAEAANRAGWQAILHPDDLAPTRACWAEAMAAQEPRELELRYRHRDGGYRWFEVAFAPLCEGEVPARRWIGTATDVHERKEAERKLRRVLEANPLGAVLCDAAGNVSFANDAYLRLVGFTREQFERGELSWTRLTPPEYRERDQRAIAQAQERGISDLFEKEYLRPDGRRVPLLLACASLGDSELAAFTLDMTDRKRVEAQARTLASVVENSSDFIGICTPDMKPLFLNEAGRRMVGLREEEVAQTRVLDYFWPEDRPRIEAEAIPLLLRDGRWSGEVRFRHFVSGQPIDTLWNAFVIRDEAGTPVAWATISPDLSRLKRAERALRASEARLRGVFDNAGVGILEVDGEDRVVAANDRVLEILGYRREELLGRSVHEITHPDDRARTEDFNRRLHHRGSDRLAYQKRYLRRDGVPVWVHVTVTAIHDEGGRLLRSVGTVEDITDRKRAEEALRQSEAAFRQLAEAMPQLVWMTRPDGYHEYFNPRWYEYTGTSPGDTRGDLWSRLLHPEDLARTLERWRRSLETGEPYEIEYRFRGSDGVHRWFLGRALPLRDERGRIARWFGTCTDIEEQKQALAELAMAKRDLEEADRRKNEFLAVLSHELRNPLSPIRNSVFILGRAAPGGPQASRALSVIDRQVGQMSRLIEDLLDVTRISRGKIRLQHEKLDLGKVVRATAEDHHTLYAATGVSLSLRVAADGLPLAACGDPTRLAQVVANLLTNAAKFTPPGGTVTLSLEREADDAVLKVQDTGAGLSPELLGRLFQPFVQADRTLDRSKGGLGLGLALVKGLVELHGGTVGADSDGPGRGACFTVRLPLEPVCERGEVQAPARRAAPASARCRVLIVEDNVDAAESLKEVLELDGHRVAVAHAGPEGIEKARALRPDVVLCDIGLPGIDGYEVARRMRADPDLRGIRLVALSGYALPEDLARAKEVGFARHLAKPPDFEALQGALAGS